MPGCTFQQKWLDDPALKVWIQRPSPTDNNNAAFCKICRKTIDLTSMGKTAVTSHLNGKKHQALILSTNASAVGSIHDHFQSATCSSGTTSASQAHGSDRGNMLSYVTVGKTDTLTAEVWWTLNTVNSNHSFSSNSEASFILQQMFPDSSIANKFTCGETKSMYLTCFGISTHFSALLENNVKNEPFVMLFDESLNKELQKKQLDILIRYWNNNTVESRYYTSDFLGHACAVDLVKTFEEKVENNFSLSKLVQLSMDGPNVNWSTFKKLQNKIELEYNCKLLNVGSCGIHTLHNAYKSGVSATKWDISHQLDALHRLLDDVPARREDYENSCKIINPNSVYPLPFCAHRWVENVKVCERAMEVIPYFQMYIKAVGNKKYKNPGTKSFDTVKVMCADTLIIAKLAFIVSVAKCVEKFLRLYQTDKPMLPFLACDLEEVMRSLMCRFLKSSLMDSASTQEKLDQIDVTQKENQKNFKHIDIGFQTDLKIGELREKDKISDRQILEFRMECKECLCAIVSKFKSKSPLSYDIVRNLSCLDPKLICEKGEDRCVRKFKKVLNVLHNCNRVSVEKCDGIVQEYSTFVSEMKHNTEFKEFKKNDDKHRLDNLFYNACNGAENYVELWTVIRQLLLISHGQASVERGFSINKEVSVQNMSESTLIARRTIKDHIKSVGGLKSVRVTKELLHSAQGARHKYQADLDAKKQEAERKKKSGKRKLVEEETDSLRKKIKMSEETVQLLNADADKAAEQAEMLQSVSHISKSNALRNKAKETTRQLDDLKQLLCEKPQYLANL